MRIIKDLLINYPSVSDYWAYLGIFSSDDVIKEKALLKSVEID